MLATTEGIVLHSFKYGENSVIATIYTRDFGRQSYLINAAHGKHSKNKAGILQPLFLVDLVAYYKQSRELNRIKEIKSHQNYQNISFDIAKSTIAIFLSEMLYRSIHEQESYPEMFEFIKHAFLYFDLMDKGTANFHIYFLYRLTEYLGFLPELKRVGFQNWFDMKKGEVVHSQPSHPFYSNKEVTEYLIKLSEYKLHEIANFKVPGKMREELLSAIVEYYQLHFDDSAEIKSLNILREVFG